jgi:3',5'-nucleoside bisphosphate phosphatase
MAVHPIFLPSTHDGLMMYEHKRYRKVDLHCHSFFSDGVLNPTELIELAVEQQIELLALTDHDTISGLADAHIAAKCHGVRLINGVEISTQWCGIPLHMVALNFVDDDADLLALLDKNQAIRIDRAKRIALMLQKQGLPDLFDLAQQKAGVSQIGRPHFASVMVEMELVKDVNRAFERYLGNKHLGQLRNVWPELAEVLRSLSGRSIELVLAHPRRYPLTVTKLKRLLQDFVLEGGTAIEIASGNEKPEDVRLLERLSREFAISCSIGSDFHAAHGPWSQLGKITPIHAATVQTVWHNWH